MRWKPLYEKYAKTRSEIPLDGPWRSLWVGLIYTKNPRSFLDLVRAQPTSIYFEAILSNEGAERVESWLEVIEELQRNRRAIEHVPGDYEDVYHAALAICVYGGDHLRNHWSCYSKDGLMPEWNPAAGHEGERGVCGLDVTAIRSVFGNDVDNAKDLATMKLFRGLSRDHYGVQSRIARLPFNRREEHAILVAQEALTKTAAGTLNLPQALATTQHYSGRLGTHLMDVTYEPLVALFFAAFDPNGPRGSVGVVARWSVSELHKLGFVHGGPVGSPKIITVPNAPRIQRQRGWFVDGYWIEQTSPYFLRFRQQPDLRFEDRWRNLTEDYLIKKDDADPFLPTTPPTPSPPQEIGAVVDEILGHVQMHPEQVFDVIKAHCQPTSNTHVLRQWRRLATFHTIVSAVQHPSAHLFNLYGVAEGIESNPDLNWREHIWAHYDPMHDRQATFRWMDQVARWLDQF